MVSQSTVIYWFYTNHSWIYSKGFFRTSINLFYHPTLPGPIAKLESRLAPMFCSICLHCYPSPSTHSSPAGNIMSCTTPLTINPMLQPSSPNVLISSQFLRWPRKFSDNSSSLLTISWVYGHSPPGLVLWLQLIRQSTTVNSSRVQEKASWLSRLLKTS